jgi:hypothetical protein
MKATLKVLAALMVSTLTFNAASAQSPYEYPVVPAGFGHGGAVEGTTTGGCSSCGGCGGKTGLIYKLGLKADGGCDSCGKHLFKKDGCGCGDGKCGWLKSCLCKPYPSNAPVLRKNEYPLGFPAHPYARSPRDYFMWNDP